VLNEAKRDQWAEWILQRRFGAEAADAGTRAQFMEPLWAVRDAVLDHAEVGPDLAVLDVGCGDGLIGFGGLERGAERVIFADISQDLLETCQEAARSFGLEERSEYIRASADDLSALDDASVDVVTTRSVLIYVDDKPRAFAEFHRVLREGGRISLYEPINRFALTEGWEGRFWVYPADGLAHLAEKVSRVYASLQPPTGAMLNFDERDLLQLAEQAGFFPIELKLAVEIRAPDPQRWDVFLKSSGNPKIPTFAEAMEDALTLKEQARVEAHLKPLVERGEGIWRMAHAYLWATKPQAHNKGLSGLVEPP
jgi:arsenite methyltransferase